MNQFIFSISGKLESHFSNSIITIFYKFEHRIRCQIEHEGRIFIVGWLSRKPEIEIYFIWTLSNLGIVSTIIVIPWREKDFGGSYLYVIVVIVFKFIKEHNLWGGLVVPIEVEQEQSSIFLNNTWHENEHFCYFFIYLFSILIYSQGKREDRNWLDNLCTLFILDCRFQRQNDFGRILHDLIYIYVIVVIVFWFI